jgi:thiamine biosynthesis protein ThiS
MNVTLKLYATLTDYLPAESRATNAVALTVDPETTVEQVIEQYRLPPRLTHLVLINGSFVPPGERKSRRLQEGDSLAIWPPIAGG